MNINNSNIVETGYTQGYEYSTPDGQSYKGFYHKDTQGRYWTGETHTSTSFLLRSVAPPPLNINNLNNEIAKSNVVTIGYSKKYTENLDTPFLKHTINLPTQDDYDNGYFVRYVAQLKAAVTPENNIVEINKPLFDLYSKNSKVLSAYRLASFNWKLSGPIEDVYENNIRIISGIFDSNLRSLQDVEKVIKGLSSFITDPLQFANISFKEI